MAACRLMHEWGHTPGLLAMVVDILYSLMVSFPDPAQVEMQLNETSKENTKLRLELQRL